MLSTFERVFLQQLHVIAIHNQMLEIHELLEDFFRYFVNLKVENVQHVDVRIAVDSDVCVVFDEKSRHFTNVIL